MLLSWEFSYMLQGIGVPLLPPWFSLLWCILCACGQRWLLELLCYSSWVQWPDGMPLPRVQGHFVMSAWPLVLILPCVLLCELLGTSVGTWLRCHELLFLFLKKILLCICILCLHVHLHARRGHQVIGDCEPPHGCWESNSGPSGRAASAFNGWAISPPLRADS